MEEIGWFNFSVEPIHMATMNPVPEYWKQNLVSEEECEFWAHKELRAKEIALARAADMG
jgi:pyridoxine/pyridoxamine 5'-phosphate oxidase